jgi:citrate synthase
MAEEIYSPGLEGVIAGETAVSTVSGGLSYRGYSIEDLARYGTFEEVSYLLLYGELPTAEHLDDPAYSASHLGHGRAAFGGQHARALGPGCERHQP